MSVWLLDVNVLVARLWRDHIFNPRVKAWFHEHPKERWATCAITHLGFARIVSNPAFSSSPVAPHEALGWLNKTIQESGDHEYWDSALQPASNDVVGSVHIQGYSS